MREVLLDAALTVLQRDGAIALTVRNITAEAGCSTTGIYTYFGGKHGLIEAIYLDGFGSFDRELSAHYAAGALLQAGLAYRKWALANPTHYLVMFGRVVPDFAPSEQAMDRAGASFELLVSAVRQLGVTDPSAGAYHLFATVHGYVMLELIGMGPVDPGSLDDLYEAGLHRAVSGLG